jgi:hypothetical protein
VLEIPLIKIKRPITASTTIKTSKVIKKGTTSKVPVKDTKRKQDLKRRRTSKATKERIILFRRETSKKKEVRTRRIRRLVKENIN